MGFKTILRKINTSSKIDLVAESVGVPCEVGNCRPETAVDIQFAKTIDSSQVIFPKRDSGLNCFSVFYARGRSEYVPVTLRQLRGGLLQLASHCYGGGAVSLVSKPNGRQRAVCPSRDTEQIEQFPAIWTYWLNRAAGD